ncbi:MAG: HAMP domain-containing protein [Pirellulales bacterium]|nr:HAMP domain-containing protein [Pirellulales bacterium]
MSYRSFKRVLGETSLERKCRFLFGACLLLLITGSFWWYGQQTEKLVYRQNQTRGRLLVDTIMTLKHWEGTNTQDEKDFAQGLSETLQNQQYGWTTIRPDSSEAAHQPKSADEDAILAYFLKTRPAEPPATTDPTSALAAEDADPHVEFVERYDPTGEKYLYYQAVRAKSSCITCHAALSGNLSLSEGDLLSVVKVEIPEKSTRAELNRNRAILLATAIVTVFLAMIAAYVIVRYVIVKPLKHLRDVSDAISHGDLQSRAEIHTGDEFEELGVAFNRMLRHLVDAQGELRQVNADLDNKVDELAQVNMQLFEMNRLKSDFLATMSHELRTPLNSIIGFSDVLGSISSLDDKQKRYVQNIQKSGKMLLDMINDILDLAKIESGKMELRLADFRIEHVIAAQCDMARPLTEKKNIDLETQIAAGLPPLHQDQGKVQQVLNNLLSNAIKFTPEGGRIVVSARRDSAGQLELVVADTGVGIAESDQVHIFEKFRQGMTVIPSGDAMTREYSGTGLGLSIVKELCRLLGGRVSLHSELGKGSTFTIAIPWSLAEKGRGESAFAESVDELTRPRRSDFEHARIVVPQSVD